MRVVETIRPGLDAMRDKSGFRVDEALYLRVLKDEKET